MDINDISTKTSAMADNMCDMLGSIEKAFMEHKAEYLAAAMKKESEINELEKAITGMVLELSKTLKAGGDKKELIALQQVVVTLERMGDEGASLVERIEIKNAEKLLFSDMGVAQFNETFSAMRKSVEMMREFLKTKTGILKDKIIDNGFHVKELVERYRAEHAERLVKGICTPMAANMFFDMLDFTGNLARHSSNIAKLF
jgi:phosphate:Na+ symporter